MSNLFSILYTTFHIYGLVVVISSIIMSLPRKYNLFVTSLAFMGVLAFMFISEPYFGLVNNPVFPNGVLYLPIIIFLFKGNVFKKVFALFMQIMVVLAIILFASMMFGFFMPYGSTKIFIYMMITTTILYTTYLIWMFNYGKKFLNMLFEGGSRTQWALYMISVTVIYAAVFILRIKHEANNIYHFGIFVFVLLSFIMLCYAIINTHEKTKKKYEADFARSIVSSGREHYQKMDEMHDRMRVLRHDYKYHLHAARKMFMSGETQKALQYLAETEEKLSAYEVRSFCSNSVLNALIASYAERFEALDIKFDVNLDIPEPVCVQDYDMCIVFGNLLENAMEASQRLETGRKIELGVKTQGTQLVIVTRNSFDGHITQFEDKIISVKKDGGLGLRSIQEIAARYGGELLTEWDDKTFTSYVYMGL